MSVVHEVPSRSRLRVMTISKAADLYLGELARMGRKRRTIDTYRRVLDKLSDAYPHNDVDEVTAAMARRFLDGYQFNRKRGGQIPNKPATTAQITSIVTAFFEWLHEEGEIVGNPCERIRRPKLQRPEDNDAVVTISTDEARLILAEADRSPLWDERLAVNVAAYLGPRRAAISRLRLRDYDPLERTLRFEEKGDKVINKPCPTRLADTIDAAIAAGTYTALDDYLVPSRAAQRRPGDRDDRCIWKRVKDVAGRVGVHAHVHSLRAAFATFYLEEKPDKVIALQNLMGHARLETTLIYLRRLNRRQAMETVRDLDWGDAPEKYSNPSLERRRRDSNPRSKSLQEPCGEEPIAGPPDARVAAAKAARAHRRLLEDIDASRATGPEAVSPTRRAELSDA